MIKVFAIFDAKAEAYLPPFFTGSAGLALRMFASAANDSEHKFAQYAADFTLFEMGSWDELTGLFKLYDAKINLGTALEHVFHGEGPKAVPVTGGE